MIASGQPRRASALHVALRILVSSAALCLLSLTWFSGRAPTVHAAGPGYCVIPPTVEHAPTRPAIHLNYSEGPIGMRITVSASGWHPGARVRLHFDGRDLRSGMLSVLIAQAAPQAIVASDGSVTITSVEVPSYVCNDPSNAPNSRYHFDIAGGSTGYFVLASDDGEVSAPVAFRLLPAPSVAINGNGSNSYQIKVGATITVAGSGWEPNEALTISLRSGGTSHPPTIPYASGVHATTDAHGSFTASYPLDPRLPWNRILLVMVEGASPRYGTYDVSSFIYLLPAIQPTFQVDHTLVTPGMAITVSGAHWFPGDVVKLKLCDSQLVDGVWSIGPNCGKAIWPILTEIPIDAGGHMRQQVTIPAGTPLGEGFLTVGVDSRAGVKPIPIRVVDHLPTWDEIHPRVAALRNRLVASLPFSIPAALLLGTLSYFGIRRWRGKRFTE